MPVANREVVQLTPLPSPSPTNYFNSPSPTLANVETGLAIFALFIIARFCLTRLYVWLRQLGGAADRPIPTRTGAILPHHRFQQQELNFRPAWTMDEKDRAPLTAAAEVVSPQGERPAVEKLVIDPNWSTNNNTQANSNTAISGGDGSLPRPLMSRPPPAPPLTPPELSTAVFTFEDRPRPGDDSFMRQPNPDYMSSTTGSDLPLPTSSSAPLPSMPRRRSYNKTLPIGVPMPRASQTTDPVSDVADLTFSPSSYPPTSPLLPPAPPQAGVSGIGVKGEIIGVLDGEGAGWTRHTRVYGGGVCLACAASGGSHGGGFYGATVRPEEMR